MNGLRLYCVVPGCSRTRGQRKGEPQIREGQEWVCGLHWKPVPAYMRLRKSMLARRYRRTFGDTPWWKFPAGSDQRINAVRLDRLRRSAWAICKRAAIERGIGLK